MRRLKEIALELLSKYDDSKTRIIYEYSFSIDNDLRKLEDEYNWYREEIEAAVGELNCCEKCKNWTENFGGGGYGYCYLEYGSPRTTDASDYCSWWEKKKE